MIRLKIIEEDTVADILLVVGSQDFDLGGLDRAGTDFLVAGMKDVPVEAGSN